MATPNRPVEAENDPAGLAAYGSPAWRVRLARALGSGMPNGGLARHTQLCEPFLPLLRCPQFFCTGLRSALGPPDIERRSGHFASGLHALATPKLMLDLQDSG